MEQLLDGNANTIIQAPELQKILLNKKLLTLEDYNIITLIVEYYIMASYQELIALKNFFLSKNSFKIS